MVTRSVLFIAITLCRSSGLKHVKMVKDVKVSMAYLSKTSLREKNAKEKGNIM